MLVLRTEDATVVGIAKRAGLVMRSSRTVAHMQQKAMAPAVRPTDCRVEPRVSVAKFLSKDVTLLS